MDETATYQASFGTLQIVSNGEAIISLKMESPHSHSSPQSSLMKDVFRQLDDYFAGNRTEFDFPLQLDGTPFQQSVWNELLQIPYGETISYQELAKRVGNPKASRAVGNANGKNPVCIVVPCHRVVRANGDLGGYAYGIAMKKSLLSIENKKLI